MVDIKKAFDGFNVHLTIDEEGDWQANLAELPQVSAESKKEYSGHFSIRVDKRVHCALAQAGISLNALVTQKLARHVRLHKP